MLLLCLYLVLHSSRSICFSLLQVASDFSSYQLSKLMTQSRTTRKLEEVRQVLKSNETAVMGLGEESRVHDVETSKILSSEGAHYILVRGRDINSQSSQDEDDEGGGWKEREDEHSGGWKERENELSEDKNTVTGRKLIQKMVDEEVRGVATESPHPLGKCPSPPQKVLTSPHTDTMLEQDNSGNVEQHSSVWSKQLQSTGTASDQTPTPHTDTPPEQYSTTVMGDRSSPIHGEYSPPTTTVHSPPATADPSTVVDQTHPPSNDQTHPPSSDQTHTPPHTTQEPIRADSPEMTEIPSPPHTQPPTSIEGFSQTTRVQPPHSKLQAVLDASHRRSEMITISPQNGPENSPVQSDSSSSEDEWTEDLLSLPPTVARARLREEARELGRESGRQSRAAAAVSNIMYKEAQVRILND